MAKTYIMIHTPTLYSDFSPAKKDLSLAGSIEICKCTFATIIFGDLKCDAHWGSPFINFQAKAVSTVNAGIRRM